MMTSIEKGYAEEACRALLNQFNPDHPMRTRINALSLRATGPTDVRRWFQRHEGKKIETVQARVSEEGRLYNTWEPGERYIRDVTSTRAAMGAAEDYSWIDFRSMMAVAASEDGTILVVWRHTMRQAVIYWLVD